MYKKFNSGWLKHWDFELLDLICMEIAFFLAYFYRHPYYFPKMPHLYIRFAVFLALFDVACILFANNYKGIIQRTKWPELLATVKQVSLVEVLLLLYTYLLKEANDYSRTVFLVSWGASIILCYVARILLKKVVRHRLTKEKNQAKMLLITSDERAGECIDAIMKKPYRGFKICAIALLHEEKEERVETNTPILYGNDTLMEYIRQEVVDEVYIDYYVDREELTRLSDIFLSMGVTLHISTSYLPDNLPNRFVEKIGDATAFTSSIRTAQAWKLALKRALDIVGGLLGTLITGIMCLFIIPAVMKADPGPIFFKQKRMGKNGRVFEMYKFRSMYMDAEARKKELMSQNEMNGLMFKIENDPRIIGSEKGEGKGYGNFIRKTSVDEFPQFLNILKGDMSLVGTRPPTLGEFEQYDLHHKVRLSMKPGLTGMWQVSGRSDITDFEEVVRLDESYIANWNLWLDIKILFKTVGAVFKGKGSK